MERKKLLIADDSEMNRAILANMLEQDFEIMEVSDGKEALAALQIYRKDLSALLLDIVMPEMDGFQVLEEMKQRQWLEDVPTVMISAETGSGYIDRPLSWGRWTTSPAPSPPRWCGSASSTPSCSTPGGRR